MRNVRWLQALLINGIKQDMKLEIDATVQYLLDKPKARLLFKDSKVKSPYNSYLEQGTAARADCKLRVWNPLRLLWHRKLQTTCSMLRRRMVHLSTCLPKRIRNISKI